MRYVDQLLDDVRAQIEPDRAVVDEALRRRALCLDAAASFAGSVDIFGSGSLAHGTAICPIHKRDKGLDADGTTVLDQRAWPSLGPETAINEPPDRVVELYRQHIEAKVRAAGYPRATVTVTKRAILVRFHSPLPCGEDPTVDVVLGLTRSQGGIWIPNTDQHRWDPSDPKTHTRLLNDVAKELRVARARTIRLAKAENKRTDPPALCSFNIEALAWMFVPTAMPLPESLLTLWENGAADLRARLTPDPARVSKPIKVADRDAAVKRWEDASWRLGQALRPGQTDRAIRDLLHPLWPEYVADDPSQTPARRAATAAAIRSGRSLYPAAAGGFALAGAAAFKTVRSYGS
ncbi:MAG: hypothetical protein QOJ79_2140 [Actinomycetota bacterium]|nr:hypothetical protein [Actinomycetota bacterium]